MRAHQKSYPVTTSPATIDLRVLQVSGSNEYLAFVPVDHLDIEVVGNDGTVTIKGKGPFPTSEFFAIDQSTIDPEGGKISVQGFSIAELELTHAGTDPYTVNVCRVVSD